MLPNFLLRQISVQNASFLLFFCWGGGYFLGHFQGVEWKVRPDISGCQLASLCAGVQGQAGSKAPFHPGALLPHMNIPDWPEALLASRPPHKTGNFF